VSRRESGTVVVLPAWYPTARHPVAGTFVREHARAAALHRDVVVVATADRGPNPPGLYGIATEHDGPLTVHRIAQRRGRSPKVEAASFLLAALRILAGLRAAGRPAEVLHAHVYQAGHTALALSRLARLPVVVSEHSTEFQRRTLTEERRARAASTFARADLVCPVSEDLRRCIEAYGIHARFRVVPNAVDTALFGPSDAPRRTDPRAPRLVNVAMQDPKKGLDDLLTAFAGLRADRPGATLDLVGDGPARRGLEAQAAALGVADAVRFHGLRPKPAIANLLRASDLFVLSSLSENLPVALIEALTCGLPVVATAVGGVPEMVTPAAGRLVPPREPDALRTAIAEVLDGPTDPRAIAATATRWSLAAVGAEWDAVYGEITSGRRA
jgi:glycosyltransferase involved in cell wall biosynthesis